MGIRDGFQEAGMKGFVVLFVMALTIAVIAGGGVYWGLQKLQHLNAESSESKVVTIGEGEDEAWRSEQKVFNDEPMPIDVPPLAVEEDSSALAFEDDALRDATEPAMDEPAVPAPAVDELPPVKSRKRTETTTNKKKTPTSDTTRAVQPQMVFAKVRVFGGNSAVAHDIEATMKSNFRHLASEITRCVRQEGATAHAKGDKMSVTWDITTKGRVDRLQAWTEDFATPTKTCTRNAASSLAFSPPGANVRVTVDFLLQ